MAFSKTNLANQALLKLGQSSFISDFDEQSTVASVIRQSYETCLKRVLRDFRWPFATKQVALALVSTDPTIEWSFAYRYPADCIMLRKFITGDRTDAQDNRIDFEIVQDSQGGLVYCDEDEAVAEYTFFSEDVSRFPADFYNCVAELLGSEIAAAITSGDAAGLGATCFKRYNLLIGTAKVNALNERQDSMNVEDSPSIQSRT